MRENDQSVHHNLVMLMDRRLSNVRQQLRYESETIGYSPYGSRAWSGQSETESFFHDSVPVSSMSIVHQPKASLTNEGGSQDHTYVKSTDYYKTYQQHLSSQKRRKTTIWEALTGLVCSLGALATRTAKMAARKSESL